MSLLDGIGIDLGTASESSGLYEAARELGARLVRVRFTLGNKTGLDDDALAEARRTVDSARSLGLRILAVIDGDLTVAPGGAGAFDDATPTILARVWSDELAANAARLAGAIGDGIDAWEILPEPNAGLPHRIAPGRWAALVAQVATALQATNPGLSVVAGSLVSDEVDDGVEYLHAAYEHGRSEGSWPEGSPPFGAIAIRLDVLPEGGASEDDVAAALTERTRRLWRVVENLEGTDAAERRGILVTGVSWDALHCAADVQGRNAWTALDTLTADPVVRGVIWSSLVDGPDHARGLIRGASASEGEKRPAWRAFRDFASYAVQISPPPRVYDSWSTAAADEEPVDDGSGRAESIDDGTAAAGQFATEPGAGPDAMEPDGRQPAAAPADAETGPDATRSDGGPDATEADGGPDAVETGALSDAAPAGHEPTLPPGPTPTDPPPPGPPPSGPPPPAGRSISFHIPDAAEVLRQMGISGTELEAALAAVVARHGGYQWLPPGDYEIRLPDGGTHPSETARHTNQHVISALYRAGGGTWAFLDKSGLSLSELANRREETYDGPPLDRLPGLTADEIARVKEALEELDRDR